jgi:hypothetical protein
MEIVIEDRSGISQTGFDEEKVKAAAKLIAEASR